MTVVSFDMLGSGDFGEAVSLISMVSSLFSIFSFIILPSGLWWSCPPIVGILVPSPWNSVYASFV